MVGIGGLVSGMDTQTIIAQLMQLERMPQQRLVSQKNQLDRTVNAYRNVNTAFLAMKTAAEAVTGVVGATGVLGATTWGAAKATSSDTTRVGVTASSGAAAASLSFFVKQLASASSVASSNTVASLGTAVASGPVLLSQGLAPLGIRSADHGAALSLGAHTVEVTQASAAAVKTGTGALAASTTVVAGTNDTIRFDVNGTAVRLVLAPGTYTQQGMVDQINAQITAAAGAAGNVVASKDSAGVLRLATTAEGSAHSIMVTGGRALTDLRLTVDTVASTGVDGKVVLDGDTAAALTVTSVKNGTAATVSDSAGDSVNLVFSGGLRLGKATSHNVDVAANATLQQTVDAVNKAGAGLNASAVKVADGAYKLQLTSTTTGAATGISVNPDAWLTGTLGTLNETSAAKDALITVGSGAGAYDVTRKSNTITDLLDKVAITLVKADPATQVTVTVEKDSAAVAEGVKKLVEAANAALAKIKEYTSVNPDSGKGSLLTGDGVLRGLQQKVLGLVNAAGSSAEYGVSVSRNGTITFDQEKFLKAYAADPDAVNTALGAGTRNADGTIAVAGFAERVRALGEATSRTDTSANGAGSLTSAIKAREDSVKGFTSRISAWDARLELREAGMRKRFAAMESALGRNQSQMAWLQGQLAQLPRAGGQ